MTIEGRAIRADNFFLMAHIKIDMGMVKWCLGTDTLKFLCAYLNFINADIIVKTGKCAVRHLILAFALAMQILSRSMCIVLCYRIVARINPER